MINRRLILLMMCISSLSTVQAMQQMERKAEQNKAEQKKTYDAKATQELSTLIKWDWRNRAPQERLVQVKKLIKDGADVNAIIHGNRSILFTLAISGELASELLLYNDIEIYKALLEAGANPLIPGQTNSTADYETPREHLQTRIDSINRYLSTPYCQIPGNDNGHGTNLKRLQDIVVLLKEYEDKYNLEIQRKAPPAPPLTLTLEAQRKAAEASAARAPTAMTSSRQSADVQPIASSSSASSSSSSSASNAAQPGSAGSGVAAMEEENY